MKAKKLIRILFISLAYTLSFLISAIVLYLGLAFLISRISIKGQSNENAKIIVYLMKSGVHSDFVLPVKNEYKDWHSTFPLENTGFKDSSNTLISIGWGDKQFYMNTPQWSDLTFSTAVSVPFGIGPSAIHATYLHQTPSDRPLVKLRLTQRQYLDLVNYIEKTLKHRKGKTIYLKASKPGVVTGNDAYYAAKGRYNLFKTCNTWVNNGLKACHQKACYWTAFAGGIFYQYGK